MKPLSKLQNEIMQTMALSGGKEVTGIAVATWLLRRQNRSGIAESLKSLVRRGLLVMNPAEPANDWERQYPDRMKAKYKVV